VSWYSWFSHVYDQSLEKLYAPYRARVFAAVEVPEGQSALCLACGTGQDFPFLAGAVREAAGTLIGLDASSGMLARAEERARREGYDFVRLLEADLRTLDRSMLTDESDGGPEVGLVVASLALSVLPEWEDVFARSWELLAPGGRFIVFDCHARKWNPQKPVVELMARADLDRKTWEPLERVSEAFSLEWLDASPWTFGGDLFAASGTKAR